MGGGGGEWSNHRAPNRLHGILCLKGSGLALIPVTPSVTWTTGIERNCSEHPTTMNMAFLCFLAWIGIAVTSVSLGESELPVGQVFNKHPALTWNDSNFSDPVVSYNRMQGRSKPLRKSDNCNGGFTSILVTGIVVVIPLTTQAAALITRKVRGSGNSYPSQAGSEPVDHRFVTAEGESPSTRPPKRGCPRCGWDSCRCRDPNRSPNRDPNRPRDEDMLDVRLAKASVPLFLYMECAFMFSGIQGYGSDFEYPTRYEEYYDQDQSQDQQEFMLNPDYCSCGRPAVNYWHVCVHICCSR